MLLAVVVPFREQPDSDREGQLRSLERRMAEVLRRFDAVLHVVEQSADGRRFNRGQLLNVGALLASGGGATPAICFHDVDLLPGKSSEIHYRDSGQEGPLHIGSGFARYSGARGGYLGGILLMCWRDVVATNGFPNNFWGWGGEDDALRERCAALELSVRRPCTEVIDLERDPDGEPLTIAAKMRSVKQRGAVCEDRHERRARDAVDWRLNGINSLHGWKVLAQSTRQVGKELQVVHSVVELADTV